MGVELGQRIQENLNLRGMSRKQLSEETGLTEAALSRYITGQREPKSVTLSMIAKALGVSMDELLGTPCEDTGQLDDAIKLVARSAGQISQEQRDHLLKKLLQL